MFFRPFVCPDVCPSDIYSHISWQICSAGVSMEASCIEEGFKTIWEQIYAQEKDRDWWWKFATGVKKMHKYGL